MQHKYLMHTLELSDIEFVGGEGAYLRTANGDRYLDFFTDVGTSSLGYGGPDLQGAAIAFATQPIHAPNKFQYSLRSEVASKLCQATGMDKVFFCNSGTESVEAAIKLARRYHYQRGSEKIKIWSYKGGFHGRTYGGLSAGDGPKYHYDGFGPMLEWFGHFSKICDIPIDAAAVILSPVFGNNDVILYEKKWLEQLREYTLENDIVLIFDEVQTGVGRCGAMTYSQLVGINPDIITLAKGLGMGFPVGAMLAKQDVANGFSPGCHFSTFGGNPASCIHVDSMLKWLRTGYNLANVASNGGFIKQRLEDMGWPRNVRGVGMLIAFDLLDADTIEFSEFCLRNRLLIGAFRTGSGPIKITPPLNIPTSDLDYGLQLLDKSYREMKGLSNEL